MYRSLLILLIIHLYCGSISAAPKISRDIRWIDTVLTRMPLDEKIGQLFMLPAYSDKNENYNTGLQNSISRYKISGLLFLQGDPAKQTTLTARCQKTANFPLLIGVEAGQGLGEHLNTAMLFPQPLTAGALSGDSLIFRMGATIASQCRELGIHINFFTVAGAAKTIPGPIPMDNNTVAGKITAYAKGNLSEGVIPVPCESSSQTEQSSVYALLAQSGLDVLRIADLRDLKGNPEESELIATLTGHDLLLTGENIGSAIETIKKAIVNGQISNEEITRKCRKILLIKHKFVLPNIFPDQATSLWSRINRPEDVAVKQEIYKGAITLIRNQKDLLPLKRLDTLRIASFNFGGKAINSFQSMLSKYSAVNHFFSDGNLSEKELDEWKTKLSSYNCIIFYNAAASENPSDDFGYTPSLAKLIRLLDNRQIIFCHPASPLGLSRYMPLPADAFLVSYEKGLNPDQYAAQAIFGGIAITGNLPVSISDDYPSGSGIPTIKTRLGYQTPEMCRISSTKLKAIDSLCETAIRTGATPGCQVMAAKDGYIFYNKAFGYNTYENKVPDHTSNIYDVASVTKITATLPALMKLYDERLINLNAALSDYYPPLKATNKKTISVKAVLCHNAGLKTFIPFYAEAIDRRTLPGPLFSPTKTVSNPLRIQAKMYANPNFHFKDSTVSESPKAGYEYVAPGVYIYPAYRDSILKSILDSRLLPKKEYAYSDLGFILLQYTIETITRKKIDEYCRENFYQKLGMSNTGFSGDKRLNTSLIVPTCVDHLYRKTEIRGYVHDPAAALLGGVAGHAGLFSSADDLAKILSVYLNKGSYGGEKYFSPETIETFTSRNTTFPDNRRGLGFDKPEFLPGKPSPASHMASASSFGHSGFTGILTWCDPEENLIYIFLSNRTYPDEYNNKLSEENIRTKIQDVIYRAIKRSPIREKNP